MFNFNTPRILFRTPVHYQLPSHLPRLLLNPKGQPRYVKKCELTQRLINLLAPLDWDSLPMTLGKRRTGHRTIPLCAYIGAYLVKVECRLRTNGQLYRFLRDHPALIWALGFPIVPDQQRPYQVDTEKSLPTQRHLSDKLGDLPNELLQNLLDAQVMTLQQAIGEPFGEVISTDTKHILAWVKENNPKQFVEERYDKEKQPKGDPDCKLGCKRKSNQVAPKKEGKPASEKVSIGAYYWGYASGIVVTKVSDVGEFVLAELTETFDHGDITYFLPLMNIVENRLGKRPKYGTADAAYDAFYTYDYFHNEEHDGFAAIPLRNMGHDRRFSPEGLPLCDADLPMVLKGTFINRTSPIKHQKGRYGCPLLYPKKTADSCPIDHKKWGNGGCSTVMPTCAGARIRYELDRNSDKFKEIYAQRTATERIFAQAVDLGIERPKLRGYRPITNHNTLIYILINLRAIKRAVDAGKLDIS